MKKVLSLLTVLVFAFSMSIPAYAVEYDNYYGRDPAFAVDNTVPGHAVESTLSAGAGAENEVWR